MSATTGNAYVVMTGDKIRGVFTDAANNGDGLLAAMEFGRQIVGSLADDTQAAARASACWIGKSPNVDGVEFDVPT